MDCSVQSIYGSACFAQQFMDSEKREAADSMINETTEATSGSNAAQLDCLSILASTEAASLTRIN